MGCNHRGGVYWLDRKKGMAECLACGTTVFVDESPRKKPKAKRNTIIYLTSSANESGSQVTI